MKRTALRTLTAVTALVFVSGCDLGGDPVARGAALAKEKGCVACHGAEGVSLAPSFPNLAGQWPRYLRVQLVKYQTGERQNAIMNAQAANLTRAEIADLAAFYAAQ